jgi:hypothetical protein
VAERQTVALDVEGSTPSTHPNKSISYKLLRSHRNQLGGGKPNPG